MLETWVHVDQEEPTSRRVQLFDDISDHIAVTEITESILPKDWKRIDLPVLQLREVRTAWLRSKTSTVARVPAVVTPGEFNYLLNPHHPDFRLIQSGKPEPFQYEARLKSDYCSNSNRFPIGCFMAAELQAVHHKLIRQQLTCRSNTNALRDGGAGRSTLLRKSSDPSKRASKPAASAASRR